MGRPKKEMTVFGSFGYGNIGDEAVPIAFKKMAQVAGENVDIVAASRFAKALMPDIYYMNDAKKLNSGGRIDSRVFLVGGGIIEPSKNSCLNRLVALRNETVEFQIQPFAVSCEPGKKFGFRERMAVRKALHGLPEILVRDENSQAALSRIVHDVPIRVIGDIVLWLEAEPLPERYEEKFPERYFVVTLADVWKEKTFFNWLSKEISEIAKRFDATALLVPISNATGDDMEQHRSLRETLVSEFGVRAEMFDFDENLFPEPGWIAEIYRRAEFVISSRLHGCIISYAQKTPFVGIGYHPKLQGFAKTVGWEDFIIPRDLPANQSSGAYGFSIKDLNFAEGSVLDAVSAAVDFNEFFARDFFRMKQVQAFKKILGT